MIKKLIFGFLQIFLVLGVLGCDWSTSSTNTTTQNESTLSSVTTDSNIESTTTNSQVSLYIITFSVENGDFLSPISAQQGTPITLPIPDRVGYTFCGWYLDEHMLTNEFVATTMPTENTSVYAKWTINQYAVEFVDYDGTILQTSNYEYGSNLSELTPPTSPTRVGYTFSNWNGMIPATMGETKITINATYTINQYTITFNSNSGTLVSTITQDYGTVVSAPNEPTRIGYTFAGWYSNNELTNIFTFTTISDENITVHAKWTINKYAVEYVDFDGTVLQTLNYEYGSNLSALTPPPSPTRVGYTFSNWSGMIPATMGETKITITATYTINQYAVEYIDYDGTVLQTINYEYGSNLSALTPPTSPTRVGYTFSNWTGTIPATMGATKIIITAKYTVNFYSVTFVANGGELISGEAIQIIEHGSDAIAPVFSKMGYSFSNWDRTFNNVSDDVIVNSVWTPHTYTIVYDGNGSTSGSTTISNHVYGTIQRVTANGFTKTNHAFLGWSLTPEGNIAYSNLGNVINLTSDNGKTVTLYAVWDIIKESVTFDGTGGSLVSGEAIQSVAHGSFAIEPIFERTGYTFSHWDQAFDNVTFSMTVHAVWTSNTYYIIYDGNGATSGSMGNSQCTYDAVEVLQINQFVKNNYFFLGWALDSDAEVEYYDGERVINLSATNDANVVLYAVWAENISTSGLHYTLVDSGTAYSVRKGTTEIYNVLIIPEMYLGIPVKYVEQSGFADCSGFTSVVLPNTIMNIGSYAFSGCRNLESIRIPSSVTSIGSKVFVYCDNLTSIKVDSGNDKYYSSGNCVIERDMIRGTTKLVIGCKNSIIPYVDSIEYAAFYFCIGLETAKIPYTVTTIDTAAFYGCSNLTALTFEGGTSSKLRKIEREAFFGCSALKSIDFNKVTTIEYLAFGDCSGLEEIKVSNFNESIYVELNCLIYKTTQILILGCKNSTIPQDVKKIMDGAFYGCKDLISISFPSSAFGVTEIGDNAFNGCIGIKSVYIPSTIVNVGFDAFENCTNLSSVTAHSSVLGTLIGSDAFLGTAWYNSQPDGVVYVGDMLYKYKGTMPSNTTITVRDGTKSISPKAFLLCSGLKSIVIPADIKKIGYQAFYNCQNLVSVTVKSNNPPFLGTNVFFGTPSSMKIYVPKDSVDKIGGYKSLGEWVNYKNQVFPIA
ncbi:MAG: leucine-rich repeat protein [Candidatus Izemoplasmatales bacterium]